MSNEAVYNQQEATVNERMKHPKVAILLSSARREQVLSAAVERQLASFAAVVMPEGPGLNAEDLSGLLDGTVACLTGWGTPPLSDELLANCSDSYTAKCSALTACRRPHAGYTSAAGTGHGR